MMFIPVLDRRRPTLCTNIKPQPNKILPGSQSYSTLLKLCEDALLVALFQTSEERTDVERRQFRHSEDIAQS